MPFYSSLGNHENVISLGGGEHLLISKAEVKLWLIQDCLISM